MSKNITDVSNVIPFRFEANEVRTLLIDDQPWFVAKDVIASLEYAKSSNPARVVDHVPPQWKGVNPIHTPGGAQNILMLSEQGLYFFIGRSDKPKALPFQMWLAGEVLPAIRKHGRYEDGEGRMNTLIGQTIGTDGFHMLGAVVKGKVCGLPQSAQRRATAKIWSQIHSAFGVRSAADIPAEQLDSARNFIAAYVVLEGEFIPRKQAVPERLNIHFPIRALVDRREGMLIDRGDGHAWLDVSLQDVGYQHESLCELIIFELQKAGYVVDAAQWELATYRNKLRGIDSFVRGLNRVIEDPQRYAVEPGGSGMSLELLTLRLTGTSPLMMHSDKLANPLHPATKAHKELTSKRNKTDEDHLAIARSEFIAGAYFDDSTGFFVPGANFDATFLAGAKLRKIGTHWKRGAVVMTDRAKLLFTGPKTPETLWDDQRFVDCRGVKVGQAKIMRYRPIFLDWAAELEVAINTDVLDIDEAKKAIGDSGKLIGVCEYRPRFGRFEVVYA